MSTKREGLRELLRLQNTGDKARANLLLSKRAPPYPLYCHHRRSPPAKTPPTARTTTPEITSSTRTEGFASLAAFDDPLGPSSPRYLRSLMPQDATAQQEKEQKRLHKGKGKGKGKGRQKRNEKAKNTLQLMEDYCIDLE
jgi:hypothetical protein